MRVARSILAALVAASAISIVSAQTGGLKVRVYDATDNSGLPGAVVVLSHNAGNIAPTTEQTDVDGYAIFPVLRAGGGYILEISFPGYAKVRLPDQRVKISENTVVPIGLTVAIQEKVEVVGRREVVDLEKNETSTKFSDQFIKDLPVQGRFYQNVLTLAPGVADDDGDGNPTVNGSRERDFKAQVGGVANVDPFTGTYLNNINSDSIEEIEVITAGAGVEYGRAQGGFANIVQKQGTNEIEGTFGVLFASSTLDGKGADKTIPDRLKPDTQTYQPSFSLSGPIKKDKLWYYVAYDYRHVENAVNALSEIVPTLTQEANGTASVTWQASARNKLLFKAQNDPITRTNQGVGADPFTGVFVLTASGLRQETGGPQYTMQWTAPYSPKLLVDTTIAYQNNYSNVVPMTSGVANNCAGGFDFISLAACNDNGKAVASGSDNTIHRDRRQRLTVKTQADIFKSKFWGTSHQFKIGFSVENERYFRHEDISPRANFTEVNDPTRDPPRQGLLQLQVYVPQVKDSRATGTTWGLWLQDEMKPLSNLTLNLGVRLDREQVASQGIEPFSPAGEVDNFLSLLDQGVATDAAIRQSFIHLENVSSFFDQLGGYLGLTPDLTLTYSRGIFLQSQSWEIGSRRPGDINIANDNFSPFLSAAWDPWSDGKTKFAVTVGRHYNNIPLIYPTEELQPASAFVTLSMPYKGAETPHYSIRSAAELDAALRLGGGINPSPNVVAMDRNFKTPHLDELVLSAEREIANETTMKLTYLKRQFRDQPQQKDINHAPGDYGHCVLQQTIDDPTIAGPPDGIIDDCIGRFVPGPRVSGTSTRLARPDGYQDLYALNPAFGGIFLLGNFNSTDYDGITLELNRRQYKGWELNGSYTWSRAVGDAEDYDQLLGTDPTQLILTPGVVANDRTHVVKVNGTTITPWGFHLGGSISWQSGLPYSLVETRLTRDAVPPQYLGLGVPEDPHVRTLYVTHERNDQRNEPYWLFNVRLAKEMNLKGGKNLQLSAEIFNLLNNDYLDIAVQSQNFQFGTRDFGRKFQLGMKFSF